MKYDHLSKKELVDKINQFEDELKRYVNNVDHRYKVFFERNLAGIYRTKIEGELIDCNDAMAQIMGFRTREELIGLNVSMLYQNINEREKNIEILKDNKFVRNQKLQLIKKDGSPIWVSLNSSAITNPKTKQIEYFEGTVIDITELIVTQNMLIKNEENYKQMLDESPYGILIHLEGKLKYFNSTASNILGLDLNNLDDISTLFHKKLIRLNKNKKHSVSHFDREKVAGGAGELFLDIYLKQVLYNKQEMTELSFVDIKDRIELEEEKIKTYVFKGLNDKLKKEIQDKEKVEKKLMHSLKTNTNQSARLEAIFENSSHVMWTMNRKYQFTSFNENFSKLVDLIFAAKPKKLARPFNKFEELEGFDQNHWTEAHNTVFGGERTNFITKSITQKGDVIYMDVYMNPIYDDKMGVLEASGIAHDITDKVIAEFKLTESLKEKEVLIKEIHHRVKNNLQVISSIFNLQSAFTEEEKIKEVLRESQNRIKSMAYIHESLYKSRQMGKIDFEQYVKELSKNLINSYVYKDNEISLLTETESVLLDLDIAIPCGLIVNEIVSNSLKHAFRESSNGIIAVFLKKLKNRVRLRISDDGIGIRENIFGEESNSLGIQLIQTLIEQIKGEIVIDGKDGTSIEITFPLN